MEHKIALVTGGSRGLGRWISISLAQSGVTVAVNYANSADDAEQTVKMIRNAGQQAFAVQGDVTDEAAVQTLVQNTVSKAGGDIDILINNATGPQPMLSIENSTWKDYTDQLNFFVKAPLLLLKAVLPGMKRKQSGSVINIGSEVVQIGNPHFSSYVTAKSAMIGMTRSWASELGPFGIRVNLIAPGWIPVERHQGTSHDSFNQYMSGVPLQRMGEPSDIGNAVAFLASDAAKFITGQCLSVNGGKTFGI
jgi:3-oxoacyl-[acyl-carrier protein] reductase